LKTDDATLWEIKPFAHLFIELVTVGFSRLRFRVLTKVFDGGGIFYFACLQELHEEI